MNGASVNQAGCSLPFVEMAQQQTKLGKLIQRELKRRKWSQGQLAAKAGCSQPVISAIISGDTRNPRTTVLQGIAAAFGWGLHQLIELTSEMASGEVVPDAGGVSKGEVLAHILCIEERVARIETSPQDLTTPLARASETAGLGRSVGRLQAALDAIGPVLEDLRSRLEALEMRAEAPHKPRRKAV